MEYLSTLDAGSLQAEEADPHVSLAVGALAVLAGATPEFASFTAGLGERLAEVPRFKQVLHTQPLDLGAPAWGGQGQAGSLVVAATNLIPFTVTAWAMRALTRLPQDVDELATGIERAASRLTKQASNDARLASDG